MTFHFHTFKRQGLSVPHLMCNWRTEGTFTTARRGCGVFVILAPDTKLQTYLTLTLTAIVELRLASYTIKVTSSYVTSFRWNYHWLSSDALYLCALYCVTSSRHLNSLFMSSVFILDDVTDVRHTTNTINNWRWVKYGYPLTVVSVTGSGLYTGRLRVDSFVSVRENN